MRQKSLILSTDFTIKKSYLTGKMDKEALVILSTYNAAIAYAEKRAIIDVKYKTLLNKVKNNLVIFTNNCSNLCAVIDRVIYNSETP
jgi:hypothetical protein